MSMEDRGARRGINVVPNINEYPDRKEDMCIKGSRYVRKWARLNSSDIRTERF